MPVEVTPALFTKDICFAALVLGWFVEGLGRGGEKGVEIHTHGNSQGTDCDLRDADGDEDSLDVAGFDDPVEAFEGEGEGEEVFEDKVAGEGFDGEVTCARGGLELGFWVKGERKVVEVGE